MYCRQNGNPQRKPGTEAISEAAVARISPKLMSDTKPHIQEARGTPNRINTKTKPKQKATHRYHIQTSENQRKRKTFERRKRIPFL